MDFSSIPRALESLTRRQPPLDERVVAHAQALINSCDDAAKVLAAVEDLMTFPDSSGAEGRMRWEPLAVGLFAATELLQQQEVENKKKETTVYMEGPRVPSTVVPGESYRWPALSHEHCLHLCETLHTVAMTHLEHDEPRVRTLVAKAVGAYAAVTLHLQTHRELRHELYDRVLASLHEHIAAGRDENGQYSKTSTGALDDTTGWRALETNWQCLAALVSALSDQYLTEFPLTDALLQDCQFSCITHVNRHVRAAGMAVLEQWVVAASSSSDPEVVQTLTQTNGTLRTAVVAVLKTGLADNWSQVRMAASVLCRALFTRLVELKAPVQDLYPTLLPRMCLNRFYLAQGVKLYSVETWKMVTMNSGLELVVQSLPAVIRYYVQMCDADNHAVREAACQAIAELAVRVGGHPTHQAKLQPHLDMLLQALLMCFHDESWPVRDEACLACGILCKSFPEDCRPALKTLWERWTEQLTDSIWSVREDAAVALGDALEAYGPEMLQQVLDLIHKILPSARQQPAMTQEEYKAKQNDTEAHTNSQLYSCGSLAPKLRKAGAGRIGCSSCEISRARAPWEATDGAIYLIREVCIRCTVEGSPIALTDEQLMPLLHEMVDVCRVRHFPQADDIRATLWRQLPQMARALGQQRFKRYYLEMFLDLLFSNLESRSASPLSQHAAGQCAEELAELVGVAIFRGRLDEDQQRSFDRVMREREMMPKGPSREGFSPFGPASVLSGVGREVHPGLASIGRFP